MFVFVALPTLASGWVIDNWWNDAEDIVMDEIFLPPETWSSPAQYQMSEYNEIDTTDNSHPFRINADPQFSFGANDGDNTIGFLGEAGLNSEYGLSYESSLAWAVTWNGADGRIDECDVMLDPTLAWSLVPHNSTWFQSTVLHELGHCRGLDHYNAHLSMQNSGQSKYLRDEILYMDDKDAIRQHASTVSEMDIVMYNKWHNGTAPQWMTMNPTTLREGQTINLSNITVQNRGTQAFGNLRFGIYLSTNDLISTGDQLLNTGSWGYFGVFSTTTFNWSAIMPTVDDCSTRWIGGIIDDNGVYTERFEWNNDATFTNGNPFVGSVFTPTALNILLAEDAFEPNDGLGAAPTISLPFSQNDLTVDQDAEIDYYRFTLSQTRIVELDVLFSHAGGDINVQLLDSIGAVIESSVSVTNDESIQREVPAGTYYIRVYGYGGGSCNHYDLDVQAVECLTNDDCDDGNACTTGETCSGGICQSGSPLVCDDGEVCTDDDCNPASGCVFTPNSGPCDDADACTEGDTCSGGICQSGSPLVCDDGEVCTDDGCNPASGCVFTPNTDPCDDADACTTGDTCSGGTCIGGPPPDCDDGNDCTADSCDQVQGCVNDPIPACGIPIPSTSVGGRTLLGLLVLAAGATFLARRSLPPR